MAATLATEWRKCAIFIVLFAVVFHIPTVQGTFLTTQVNLRALLLAPPFYI